MAKIYYKKYKNIMNREGLTLAEVCNLVRKEVPQRWADEVIFLLEQII